MAGPTKEEPGVTGVPMKDCRQRGQWHYSAGSACSIAAGIFATDISERAT
jgi:hypothetical protein